MSQPRYPHVIKAVFETPWAVLPSTLAMIVDVVRFRASGGSLSEEEVRDRLGAATSGPRRGGGRKGTVGVIPIYGVLMPRANLMVEMSGGTSVQGVTAAFREALTDEEIASIVLEVDSPGGSVEGIEELATEIRAARGQKPIVAVANTLAASAAYYLAAQADEIVATPSGGVGSIGVIAAHQDLSAYYEAEGIKTTLITHGKYKAESNSFEPLSEDARNDIQAKVDEFGAMFEAAVAKGRGISVEKVRADYGEGRVLLARPALKAGLVDRIDTLDNTIRRVARGRAVLRTDALGASEDSSVALGSGSPLTERLALVSAEATDLLEHAREHAAMRARADRSVSGDTRSRFVALASSFRGLAAELDVLGVEPRRAMPASSLRLQAELAETVTRLGHRLD